MAYCPTDKHRHCNSILVILFVLCVPCDSFVSLPGGELRFTSSSRARHLPLLARTRRSQASVEIGLTSASARYWLTKHSYRTAAPAILQQRNAEFAMRAREEIPVAADVDEELFLHWVLPYQHFDEPLDDWRPLFYERLLPHARNARTLREMAEIVIPLVFDGHLGNKVEFKANMTPQVMAPVSETLHLGYASCTGMSILLANALRSVGIPSRVAGVAEWNQPEGGNHNWVEVWTGDAWQFLDAVPTEQVVWNKPWFADGLVQKSVAYTNMAVASPVWDTSDADTNYTVTWRSPEVMMPAVDRTSFYKSLPVFS